MEILDYIKIDVDGIEHLILGGENTLKEKIKSILIEVNDNFLEQKNKVNEFMIGSGLILKKKTIEKIPVKEEFLKVFNYIYER